MKIFISFFLVIFITSCAPGMQRAVVFDADNNQIIATEFPGGSTVKFDGPAGKLEVIAPVPKPSILDDIIRGTTATLAPIIPFMMINALDDD